MKSGVGDFLGLAAGFEHGFERHDEPPQAAEIDKSFLLVASFNLFSISCFCFSNSFSFSSTDWDGLLKVTLLL